MEKRFITGRLTMPADAFVKEFGASVYFDQRLAPYDIQGSIAHATMLAKVGVLTDEECKTIVAGLQDIADNLAHFPWSVDLEDVHMNIENALVENIGDVGKKLHTGRSRNDQVATDIRLWLRDEITVLLEALAQLKTNLVNLAEREAHTIFPGFTHLQVAQPITFGHHMLAWFEMLQRDTERLQECYARVNKMPLGAAALAGTTFPIDRHFTAELLGFDAPCANSLDAVSDRDFAIEFSSACALIMTHLSRFSEEIVLWTSAQFDFIKLPDSFCTGSSIMPQKKNPDVPELVRGKASRVNGNLIALLTLMQSQPLAYNKDNQEDKEPLFDTVDTVKACLKIYTDMVGEITVNQERTKAAAIQGYATATDLADYLVRKGATFRDAHHVVGAAVAFAIEAKKDLSELSIETLQEFSKHIESDVFKCLTLEGSVSARNHFGGTAPAQVLQAIANIRNQND